MCFHIRNKDLGGRWHKKSPGFIYQRLCESHDLVSKHENKSILYAEVENSDLRSLKNAVADSLGEREQMRMAILTVTEDTGDMKCSLGLGAGDRKA